MNYKPLFIIGGIVVAFIVVITLQNRVKPLEDVNISEYKVVFEEEDYTIYRSLHASLDGIGLSQGRVTDETGEYCVFNEYSVKFHIVKYEGKYYSLLDAGKKNIYTCEELASSGIN